MLMNLKLAPTIVATELVADGCGVIAEMTDGSLIRFSAGFPPDATLVWSLRYRTAAQIREELAQFTRSRMAAANYALHMRKVEQLGYDYARRGY